MPAEKKRKTSRMKFPLIFALCCFALLFLSSASDGFCDDADGLSDTNDCLSDQMPEEEGDNTSIDVRIITDGISDNNNNDNNDNGGEHETVLEDPNDAQGLQDDNDASLLSQLFVDDKADFAALSPEPLDEYFFTDDILLYDSVEISQPITISLSNGRTIRLLPDPAKQQRLKRSGSLFEWYLGAGVSATRGLGYSITGRLGFNFNISDSFSVGVYGHGNFFPTPLGSSTGNLAGMELEIDLGVSILFPMFDFGRFSIKVGTDLGYYMQILQFNSAIASGFHIGYNGMIVRPIMRIDVFNIIATPIAVAFFWTLTAIVPYSDYNNIGVMLII